MGFQLFLSLLTAMSLNAQDYALDDAHNHDGTHVEGQTDCGSNYLFPEKARLGSHSFLILGTDGPEHLLLDHRSGTPPHTYQFILRVRVDKSEMATYQKLLKSSKVALPAVTTIYYDKTGKQADRTFFCLPDLPQIFGPGQKANDKFAKLFPIRATWQLNADFEGAFPIKETVVPEEEPLLIDRKDVELVIYRYLPSYLEQTSFRKMLKSRGAGVTSMLSHAPVKADDTPELAAKRSSYIRSGALESNGETCPADYYLKTVRPQKTKHAFMLMAESGKNSVLAAHLYDQSPQNYQSTLHFQFSDEQMANFRKLKAESKSPLLFMPQQYFCMAELRELLKSGKLELSGRIFKNTQYGEFKLGEPVMQLKLGSSQIKLLVHRTLQSLMNPQSVAMDVFGIVDLKTVNPNILVETAYATDWNFIGKPVNGYLANRCYLTAKAANAVSAVQKEVSKLGYDVLVFDCYRPQRAVTQFVEWVKDTDDTKMRATHYPDEPKQDLIKRGYIDSRSGHSRASVIDLTLVRKGKFDAKGFMEKSRSVSDCRQSKAIESTGQLDMGTTYDCFSELAHTANPTVSAEARQNREILKSAMEKFGFKHYPKEWWHFALKDEPYPGQYFDFEVQ